MPLDTEMPTLLEDTPIKEPFRDASGLQRYCMSCGKRLATRVIINTKGRRQYRCEACFARKSESGFGRKHQ